MQPHRPALEVACDLDGLPLDARRDFGEVAIDDAAHSAGHPGATRLARHDMRVSLHHRQRIGDRNSASAGAEKRMVVFRVPNPHNIQRRQFQSSKRCGKTACLVDARRQHHDCPLIKNDLQFEPEIAYCVEHNLLVGLPGRDDTAADRERIDLATAQLLNEKGRRRLPEQDFLPCRRLDRLDNG